MTIIGTFGVNDAIARPVSYRYQPRPVETNFDGYLEGPSPRLDCHMCTWSYTGLVRISTSTKPNLNLSHPQPPDPESDRLLTVREGLRRAYNQFPAPSVFFQLLASTGTSQERM